LAPRAKSRAALVGLVAAQSNQAITSIFEAAAAFPAAELAPAATGPAAAGTGRAPMSCCSELNKRLNRFCVEPTGAEVLLVEPGEGSSGDPFL
jgi:hypothetical protein